MNPQTPINQKETRFKIVVYFKQKSNNDFYTPQEVEEGKHIRRMGSFDRRRGKFKEWIYDEQDAYNKQVNALEKTMRGRYKTAFIVINNYKGFSIVLRKYIDERPAFIMDVKFYEANQNTGDRRIYNIPAADNLINLYNTNQLNEAQKKLIKPYNKNIPAAAAYTVKKNKAA